MGVDQNYTIVFDTYSFETTQFYYVYQQNASDIKCSAYIIAVNGAGESDPSNNVSIPSLPDIGPVTASLTHQVWKYDGEIRVNVSFQVRCILHINCEGVIIHHHFQSAKYCLEYPVLSYLLVFRIEETRVFINISLGINETQVILGTRHGLEDNQKYVYIVNAINSIGMTTTDENMLRK